MFTECPNCLTMFRVTGAILRAGHGQVECGQCHAVFDAIERLIDDLPPGPGAEPPSHLEPAAAPVAGGNDAEDGTPSTEMQWINDLPTGEFLLKDGDLVPLAATTGEVPAAPYVIEGPAVPEEITLEGDRFEISGLDTPTGALHAESTLPGEAGPEGGAETEAGVAADVGIHAADADNVQQHAEQASQTAVPLGVAAPARERPEQRAPVARETLEPYFDDPEPEPQRHTAAWALLSLILLVSLGAQAVHHYRQDLVRDPRIGPSLLQVYQTLRLPLAPNWDVTGYEIRQWGVAADPAATGTLRLKASIVNRAGFAQPYPLIKLTLEDRWGEQVGAREFEPAEYLGPGYAADRLLPPNQPVNADIGIVDPGEDAVGFHVDVCLATYSGLECASTVQ